MRTLIALALVAVLTAASCSTNQKPSPDDSAGPTKSHEQDEGRPIWPWIVGGVVVLAGITAAVLILTIDDAFDDFEPGPGSGDGSEDDDGTGIPVLGGDGS